MWGADYKFRHSGKCSASRGLPNDAEHLPEWRNFQFAPKNHYGLFFLHTLPSTIAFRLEYVLFYHFYAIITIFCNQEKFGTAPLLYVDVEIFGKNRRENDVKTSKMTSKRQNHYTDVMHECRLTLHVRRHFLATVGFTEIRVGYARIIVLGYFVRSTCHYYCLFCVHWTYLADKIAYRKSFNKRIHFNASLTV